MDDKEKAINYYKAGVLQGVKNRKSGIDVRPDWVPAAIEITRTVRGEGFGPRLIAKPGVYIADSNQFGAVSVKLDGGMLGIKPDEFEVVEWKKNPHKE